MSAGRDVVERLRGARHPYYCEMQNYYSLEAYTRFESWDDFYASMGKADPDLNHVFRWDWDDEDDVLRLAVMHQRKGRYWPIEVKVTAADEPEVRTYLEKQWRTVCANWSPIAALRCPEDNGQGAFDTGIGGGSVSGPSEGPGVMDVAEVYGIPATEPNTSDSTASPPIGREGKEDYLWAHAKTDLLLLLRRKLLHPELSYDYNVRAILDALRARLRSVPESGEACGVCGCREVWIRGRYPGEDRRKVCPTCLQERTDTAVRTLAPNPPVRAHNHREDEG